MNKDGNDEGNFGIDCSLLVPRSLSHRRLPLDLTSHLEDSAPASIEKKQPSKRHLLHLLLRNPAVRTRPFPLFSGRKRLSSFLMRGGLTESSTVLVSGLPEVHLLDRDPVEKGENE